MATHSSILAWRIPMDREASWGCKESDITERLGTAQHSSAQRTSNDMDVSFEDYVTKKITDSLLYWFQ